MYEIVIKNQKRKNVEIKEIYTYTSQSKRWFTMEFTAC